MPIVLLVNCVFLKPLLGATTIRKSGLVIVHLLSVFHSLHLFEVETSSLSNVQHLKG